jgi:hypothetical protein
VHLTIRHIQQNLQVPQLLAAIQREADLWVQAGARGLGCMLARDQSSTLVSLCPRRAEALLQIM